MNDEKSLKEILFRKMADTKRLAGYCKSMAGGKPQDSAFWDIQIGTLAALLVEAGLTYEYSRWEDDYDG